MSHIYPVGNVADFFRRQVTKTGHAVEALPERGRRPAAEGA